MLSRGVAKQIVSVVKVKRNVKAKKSTSGRMTVHNPEYKPVQRRFVMWVQKVTTSNS